MTEQELFTCLIGMCHLVSRMCIIGENSNYWS